MDAIGSAESLEQLAEVFGAIAAIGLIGSLIWALMILVGLMIIGSRLWKILEGLRRLEAQTAIVLQNFPALVSPSDLLVRRKPSLPDGLQPSYPASKNKQEPTLG